MSSTIAIFSSHTLLNSSKAPRVLPCVTPRFVPTCSEQMMAALGDLSLKYGLPVQSHLSESIGEIEWVQQLHPDCSTYAEVVINDGNEPFRFRSLHLTFFYRVTGLSQTQLAALCDLYGPLLSLQQRRKVKGSLPDIHLFQLSIYDYIIACFRFVYSDDCSVRPTLVWCTAPRPTSC